MHMNYLSRACAWVVGSLIIIANAAVVFMRAYRRESNTVSSLLILQITIADIFMGTYLLIIGATDAFFRGRYAFEASKWRHSGTCSFAGFLGLVSREAALMFVTILISRQLFTREKGEEAPPRGLTRQLQMALSLATVWLLAFVLGLLPIIPMDYFDAEFYARSALCFGLFHHGQTEEGSAYAVAIFVATNLCLCLMITGAMCVFFILSVCYRYITDSISFLFIT